MPTTLTYDRIYGKLGSDDMLQEEEITEDKKDLVKDTNLSL